MNGSTLCCWYTSFRNVATDNLERKITLHKNKLLNYVSVEEYLTVTKAHRGATNHYWRKQDATCLINLQCTTYPTVTLPDGYSLHPTQQGILPHLSITSPEEIRATILQNLQIVSLISLGQLCNNNYKVLLDKRKQYVVKHKNLVLKGT